MSTAKLIIGDVFDVLASLPDQSVQSVITSPPYWRKRAYLPADHPEKSKEIGQENSPGEFLATILRITDALWRVVRDDGTIWFDLGDTASQSGGAGGDYMPGGLREGQNKYEGSGLAPAGTKRRSSAYPPIGGRNDIPKPKSVCWIPELFGASLAYGRNLLTGEPCQQWITRPQVTWCKPAPTPGEIIDKFREATELIVWASKNARYYFDLDAVREPPKEDPRLKTGKAVTSGAYAGHPDLHSSRPDRVCNEKGMPPLNYWVINTGGYEGAHYATFPPELIKRPVLASCPSHACSICGKGRTSIFERSWDLDQSRPQAKRALELAKAGGLTTDHFEAIAAMGISEGGKAKVVMTGSGKNSDEVKRLAGEAKAVLGGYFREFIGAPMVPVGLSDLCCEGAEWVPGVILDLFGGSGTTASVATGNGRDCILVDLDDRNIDLCRERVGMFLTSIEHFASEVPA